MKLVTAFSDLQKLKDDYYTIEACYNLDPTKTVERLMLVLQTKLNILPNFD